jgi:hypothetical protein
MPTPDLVTLAQTYTDKREAYEAAYTPVGEAYTAVVVAVAEALRPSPAFAALLAAKGAQEAATVALSAAREAAKAANDAAYAPYRIATATTEEKRADAEKAIKRMKDPAQRANARHETAVWAAAEDAAAHTALIAAIEAHNCRALAAAERHAYDVVNAAWPAYTAASNALRNEAIALVAGLPLNGNAHDCRRVAEAALSALFPAA